MDDFAEQARDLRHALADLVVRLALQQQILGSSVEFAAVRAPVAAATGLRCVVLFLQQAELVAAAVECRFEGWHDD